MTDTAVQFPTLSGDDASTTGVVDTWLVSDGDTVRADQTIAVVQLDKVSVDVPAPVSGVVHLLVPEETEVAQGASIATIDASG